MASICRVFAREVLDSRGNPTVEVEVHCDGNECGTAIVPAGASTGRAEACEQRDGDPQRYGGRGVRKAVGNVNRVLGPAIIGLDPREQFTIDSLLLELDGTPQKTRLGGNALLGVSLAAAHAAAAADGIPLYRHFARLAEALLDDAEAEWPGRKRSDAPVHPQSGLSHLTPGESGLPGDQAQRPPVIAPRMPLPMVNMISGGLHAGGNLDFQDFLIQPVGAPDYPTGLEWIVRVYRRLGELLSHDGYEGRLVGDEGGYGPRLASNRQAAEFIVRAIEAARLRPGADVTIALDVASTHFYDGSYYHLKTPGWLGLNRSDAPADLEPAALGLPVGQPQPPHLRLTSDEMIDQLEALVDSFPIDSIEDGLAEEDWSGWQRLTARLGGRVRLVGDDLFATNRDRVARGMQLSAGNTVLIKVNQIGTLTETLETMRLAGRHGWWRVVSARSGETEDSTIADLAVGTAAEQIKIGSVVRSERLAKYNRLLRIAEELT